MTGLAASTSTPARARARGATRVPCSTYRLQFTAEFGFAEAAQLVPYLHRLGITDVYSSPLLRAAPGSTHGYDVVDTSELDPRLGTRDEFEALSAALRSRDMGLVLDIVPNHMAASAANPWWRDVLKHGSKSAFADHFDIDWEEGAGKLVLPVLGSSLVQVLAAGELAVEGDELVYYDRRLPLAPGTADAGTIDEVVVAQNYELTDWREQASRLNYRRFFDITDLVGLRVEQEHVFQAAHAFVLELVREGHVSGLRIDHVDGLYDPAAYFRRLQSALRRATGRAEPFYVVVEKILGPGEKLPAEWEVSGTTGYDFLDACDSLFVDRHGVERTAERYAEITGVDEPFAAVVERAKLRIMREYFWGELTRLTRRLARQRTAAKAGGAAQAVAADHPGESNEDFRRLRDAIAAVTAALPVYRTYIDERGISAEDERLVEGALAAAASHDSVDPVALAEVGMALRADVNFAMRWQQFSGPVTAKSVEDTAFYRHYAVPPRNEVGAHPSHPAGAVGAFHWLLSGRAAAWPHTMNASSTHDTKRSEDVRARMMALTAEPDWWADVVERWLRAYEAPDANDGWMVAATLVGAWPITAERLREYVLKAVKEEKLHTTWTDPDEAYESAITAFAERLRSSDEVAAVAERFAPAGTRISIAATALKLFAPGVPDTYQGTELQSLTLVDPDNRRPVDYAERERLLDGDAAPGKLRLIAGCLRARREYHELFERGEYLPLRTGTPDALAFARRLGDAWALVAVPLPGFQPASTATLELPDGAPSLWRHVVTGDRWAPAKVPLAECLGSFPAIVAVPVRP